MYVAKGLGQIIQYILDAVMEIFSPNHDNYPAIGVQPFEGKPNKRKNRAKSPAW